VTYVAIYNNMLYYFSN